MHPDLRRGDKGEAVVRLQGLLNKLGSMLVPDGDFGPGTARAVREARAEAGRMGLAPELAPALEVE